MDYKVYSMDFAGRKLTLEFGKYAQQAGGSVVVRYGETVVLVTATASDTPREGTDFFPLSVDFEEKQYSVGKIPGGFIKREGRPTEKATLTCRLIDRPLRPLFNKGLRNDVQVVATTLSVEPDNPPEFPAMIGSSIALAVSNIPWGGPTGAVMIGRVNGEFVMNPDEHQRSVSDMNVTVAGTHDAIMMVEAGANEVSEDAMMDAILYAHQGIKELVEFQNTIIAEIGKPKSDFPVVTTGEDVKQAVREYAYEKCEYVYETFVRKERQQREAEVKADVLEHFAETFAGRESEVADALYYLNKEVMRKKILNEGIRPDGRKVEEIRPIWCEVGVLPRTHGSAVFTRGETQALTVTTLGSVSEAQQLDGLVGETSKRYIHHYNMPSFATGEAGRSRSANRREIGHGALAERALLPVIPTEEEFPPVAGVAMGLIQDAETGKIAILTDIQGLEDFLGDMDFKVAGTMNGITAIQMDIKIKGINREILSAALGQALRGRLHILGIMLDTLPRPREQLSPYAPKIIQFMINPEKISEVIGPRGKMINKIIDETGVKIDIEDDGRVYISTPDQAAADKARKLIEGIAKDIEVGDVFMAKVVRIMTFGAFLSLTAGKDGMLHISKMANHRVEKVEDELNIGDEIEVKVSEIDSQGRINLIRNDIVYDRQPQQRSEGRSDRVRPPRRDGK